MTLMEFIKDHLPQTMRIFKATADYVNQSKLQDEIVPESIVNIVTMLKNKQSMEPLLLNEFRTALTTIKNDDVYNIIISVINEIAIKIFESHQEKIDILIAMIEHQVTKDKKLDLTSSPDIEKCKDILNIYLLNNGTPLPAKPNTSRPYIENYTDWAYGNILNYHVPFAINALILTKQLPSDQEYCGMRFNQPFYPAKFRGDDNIKIDLKKGIKSSDEYYPIRLILKIFNIGTFGSLGAGFGGGLGTGFNGGLGSNGVTFIATNGEKILFVRGKSYAPDAVMAAKIASYTSKKHFSSERLLDNRLAASKKLEQYELSAATDEARYIRKAFVSKENKGYISGTGIADEVLNFVWELDPNIENFGYSSTDLRTCHLSKIDFDGCAITSLSLNEQDYERNLASLSFYKDISLVENNPNYIDEKLETRLKLSMMSRNFLAALAEKAYIDPNKKAVAIIEGVKRTEIALKLFVAHPKSSEFIRTHPDIFNKLLNETDTYIKTHFIENEQENIMKSIRERMASIQTILNAVVQNAISSEVHYSVVRQFHHNEISNSPTISPISSPTVSPTSKKPKFIT